MLRECYYYIQAIRGQSWRLFKIFWYNYHIWVLERVWNQTVQSLVLPFHIMYFNKETLKLVLGKFKVPFELNSFSIGNYLLESCKIPHFLSIYISGTVKHMEQIFLFSILPASSSYKRPRIFLFSISISVLPTTDSDKFIHYFTFGGGQFLWLGNGTRLSWN